MKTFPLSVAAVAASMWLLVCAGCQSFESRAKEKSAVYNQLPASTQERLERGMIRAGDTEDMVYIALGQPSEKRSIQSERGERVVWRYLSYWQEYAGTEWRGWRRTIVPSRGGYVIYHQPLSADVYRTHTEEDIRVTFENGRVQSVEQKTE